MVKTTFEQAVEKQQKAFADSATNLSNATKNLLQLRQSINENTQASEIEWYENLAIVAVRSFSKNAKNLLASIKYMVTEKKVTEKLEVKPDASSTSKRRLGTDDTGISSKKAKLDGTEQTELADTVATEPLAKLDGTEQTELADTAATEPLAKEDGTELAELEGTSKTVTEPMEENPADTGMTEKPPLARKRSFKIFDLIKEEPKQQKKL
ncbi:hypothetical protein niasHT_034017 [Heterodera trifolii]|uniref:Uncharacterized protein n=1 Tax=Heterodera trifolii TaxID=157864 RepID=A0ABD2IL75_9BILA